MKQAVTLLLIVFPLTAVAQVFRWVDENGKVHYGDRPIAREVRSVPVLREAKPRESIPSPGMKADEVRKAYGDPDRTQQVSTKRGDTVIWSYHKSRLAAKGFVVKIEGGEVTEVSTDSSSDSAPSVAPAKPQASGQTGSGAVADTGRAEDYQARQAAREAAEKARRCDSLRASMQRVESAERRGGSAAAMDNLRAEKRNYGDQMSSQGCGS